MYFSHIVVTAGDVHPLSVRGYYGPGEQIIQRCTPHHGFFTTGIHGDVATNGRCVLRSWVDGKNQTFLSGASGYLLRYHAGARPDGGNGSVGAG